MPETLEKNITEARKAEGDAQWGEGLRYYAEGIRLLDEKHRVGGAIDRSARITEEDKHEALNWWIGYLHCKIEMVRADSESLLYDIGEEIGRLVREVEREIKKYRIGNKVYLWDTLQRAYDRWGDERRNQGKKSEADELQHYMLKARMWRDLWRIFSMNRLWQKIELVLNFVESLATYSLDIASRGVLRTIIVFIVVPIAAWAILHWKSGTLVVPVDGGTQPLPTGLDGLLYSLRYSIATFTGTDAGDLVAQGNGLWFTSAEAIMACVFIAVAIGYIVNRLSSR